MKRLLVVFLCSACMTTSSHEKAMSDLTAEKQAEIDKAAAQDKSDQAHADDLQKQLDATKKQLADLQKLLGDTSTDKAKLEQLMKATSAQMDELSKQKAAADARAATYRKLTDQLRSMIDAGKLSVKIRKGRMLISLPNDVLFDSGSAVLKKAGQDAVTGVAAALSGLGDRQFLVAGHTDDKPIHTVRFPSNWELSTARAVTVTRALVAAGMKPDTLGAVGYGEFDPILANDTDEHRASNRRIEIQLQPNLSELPAMDDLDQPAPAPAPAAAPAPTPAPTPAPGGN
jgi:chemotaxis protein MotB